MRRSVVLLGQLLKENVKIDFLRDYYRSLSHQILKNPRLFILWPISIVFIISYPALYTIYTSRNLSSHLHVSDFKSVGIEHSAFLQFTETLERSSDLEVRQVWVQRSFVGNDKDVEYEDSGVLEKEFLLEVLELQEKLVDGIHLYKATGEVQQEFDQPLGFLHSPLQYWDNSKSVLIEDKVLRTVHASANKKSSTGITLSHSSLLSGTVEVNGLVKSADALLISLIYIPHSDGVDAGSIWDSNLQKVQAEVDDDDSSQQFLLFSKDKVDSKFQKFYLKFEPMKLRDDLALVLSYIGIAVYFVLSLANMHSVRSRLGLLVAFTVEISLSALSAVSLSSYLFKDFDLSYIPLQVLPLVITAVGIENMLGMVSTVSSLPEELSMSRKLSTSLSTTGLASTLKVVANIAILILIMPFVVTSTKHFCMFAAIALAVDHFLHLTYFMAVLSVDIKRLELEDLLRNNDTDLTGMRYQKRQNSVRQISFGGDRMTPWNKLASRLLGNSIVLPSSNDDLYSSGKLSFKNRVGARLLKFKFPKTTTLAGSVFLILFLFFANLRWTDPGKSISLFGNSTDDASLVKFPSVTREVQLNSSEYSLSLTNANKFTFFLERRSSVVEISQLARDFKGVTSTKDFRFSMLVEEPVILIHKGAFNEIEYRKIKDYNAGNPRRKIAFKEPQISFDLNTTYKFDVHYLAEFLTSLVFVCSIAGLVLKLIIKDDDHQNAEIDDDGPENEVSTGVRTPFNCKDLVNGHFLDVVKITTSSNPFIISVGMDHKILVWSPITVPIPLPTELPLHRQLWPITNVVMSDPGNLIAVFSKSGSVKCWSRLTMSWAWTFHIDELRNGQYLEAFFRKRTAPPLASRKKGVKSRFSTVTEGEVSPLTTRKGRSSRENSEVNLGVPLSRTLSIDSTFDRSTDVNLLQQQQNFDFIVVLKNGKMITIGADDGERHDEILSPVPLVAVNKLISPRVNDRIVCITEVGRLVVATVINNKWKVRSLPVQEKYNTGKSLMTPSALSRSSSFNNSSLEQAQQFRNDLKASRLYAPKQSSALNQSFNSQDVEDAENKKKLVAAFANTETATVSFVGMIVRTRGLIAELIDVQTGTLIKRFNIGQFKPGTFKVFHSTPVHCRFCGSASVSSFSLCYTELDRSTLIMQTFTIDNRAKNNICLRVERDPRETRCLGFERVTEHQHWLDGVEGWSVSDLNTVSGIRKKEPSSSSFETIGGSSSGYSTSAGISGRGSLSSRRMRKEKDEQYHIENIWEGFSLSASGKVTYHDIPNSSSSEGLLIKSIGPVAKFGHKSIVVSFGNVLKVLYTGNSNLFDSEVDTDQGIVNQLGFINRRKRMNVVSYQMTHSTDYGSTNETDSN